MARLKVGIGDGELSDGRQKEEIEGERRGDGGQGCFGEAPVARNQQDQEQVGEAHGGGIMRNGEERSGRDDGHAGQRQQQAQREAGEGEIHGGGILGYSSAAGHLLTRVVRQRRR
jgi:hypothetical protein